MNVSRPFVSAPRPVAPRLVPVRAGFLPRLPLIALGIILIVALLQRIAPPRPDERPFAQGITHNGALQLAETLCTRMAKAPAKAVSANAVSTPNGDHREAHCEWQVICHAASEEYFIRLDVARSGLISLQRESVSLHRASRSETDSPENHVSIDRDAALVLSRRYLVASGLTPRIERVTLESLMLQDKGRNAWDGYFRYQGEDGIFRRARVGLSALGGKLNRIQRLGVVTSVMPPE